MIYFLREHLSVFPPLSHSLQRISLASRRLLGNFSLLVPLGMYIWETIPLNLLKTLHSLRS
jgi:hypothetical protein